MKRHWLLAACVAIASAAQVSSTQAAGLLIADGGLGGVLKIQDQTVEVTINNGIAVTEVEQVFVNTENRIVEALYTFPVPKNASVANFSMWINGKEMIGEVVEKQRAREIYESYKQTRKDPGLLEQVDYKRFEMRIFPIAAGAEQRVRITYYQELDFDHDWCNYVYPLATTTRTAADSHSESFAFRLDVKSEVPITKMESPSHADVMALTSFDDHNQRASLETSNAQLDEDVVVAFKVSRPITGLDTVASRSGAGDGFFQTTLTIGEELQTAESGMDYVFVLDISGSMRNRRKLSTSQSSVYTFIEQLGPDDRFEIITFNELPQAQMGKLIASSPENHAEAKSLLQSLQARGGTSLRPAIETAYRYADPDRPLNVVVLSDGLTENQEESTVVDVIRSRPDNCRVFAIGVGNDVNRPLLQSMANKAGGLAAFLSGRDNLDRQAEAFRRKLTRPAIEDVKLEFDGSVFDVEPRERANIYHGSPMRIYGRYRNGGPVNVTLNGTIMGAPFEKSVVIDLPEADDNNPEIERMWASYRVKRLMESAKFRGDAAARAEIVALCEEFSIVSEYASFIVLENDAEYQRWNIERKNLRRSTRDRAAQQRVQQELKRLRDQAMAKLGPANDEQSKTLAKSKPNKASRASRPQPSDLATSQQTPPQPAPRPQRRNRGRDLDFGVGRSSGGGGALDPITGMLALGLGGLGWWQKKRNAE